MSERLLATTVLAMSCSRSATAASRTSITQLGEPQRCTVHPMDLAFVLASGVAPSCREDGR